MVGFWGWFIWAATAALAALLLNNAMGGWWYDRWVSLLVCAGLAVALAVTALGAVSKFHLLWFVPLWVGVARVCTGMLLIRQTRLKLRSGISPESDAGDGA